MASIICFVPTWLFNYVIFLGVITIYFSGECLQRAHAPKQKCFYALRSYTHEVLGAIIKC